MKLCIRAIAVIYLLVHVVSDGYAGPKGAVGDLYMVDFSDKKVVQIDAATGLVVGDFVTTNFNYPVEARFGPNGNLFVATYLDSTITEFDGNTGEFIRVFASEGLDEPLGLRFKSNGHLIVANGRSNNITEYDSSGTWIGTLQSSYQGSSLGIDFGPDGNLYASNDKTQSINRYTDDGAFLNIFAQGDELGRAYGHTFGGPNNNLFVITNKVLEYDGLTGDFLGIFAFGSLLRNPIGITFGPMGNIWVTNNDSSNYGSVTELDAVTGEVILTVTGFNSPWGITVKPEPAHCLSMDVSVLTGGQDALWDVSGATPGSLVAVVYGFQAGSTVISGQSGFCATFGIDGIGLNQVVGSSVADGSGNAMINKFIPAQASGLTVLTQAAEQGTCPDECVSGVDTQVVQ